MPIRPFPYPLHIGIDICLLTRIGRLIFEPRADMPRDHKLLAFLNKLMTTREQLSFRETFGFEHATTATSVIDQVEDIGKLHRYLAGRWAAKEAAIKAVKPRRIGFKDVEVFSKEFGQPYAVILDRREDTSRSSKPDGDGDISQSVDVPDGSSSGQSGDSLEKLPTDSPLTLSGQIARLSISHDGAYVTAVCLAVEDLGGGDVGGEAAARSLT